MSNVQKPDIRVVIEALLEREHRAILVGNFSDLADIIEVKKSVLSRIDQLDLLRSFKDQLARNQRLLEATIRGVRAAHKKLFATSPPSSSFQTYDRNGSRQSLSSPDVLRSTRA